LRLDWQIAKRERALAIVQRNGARQIVRLEDLRLRQLGIRKDLFDAARTKRGIGRELGSQLRHHLQQLVTLSDRIADAMLVGREYLLKRASREKVTDVKSRRLLRGRPKVRVQTEVA